MRPKEKTMEKYHCETCDGTGKVGPPDAPADSLPDCARCDGLGVTHIDCEECGKKVEVGQEVFVGGKTYCETHGDRIRDRPEARR